MAKKKRYYKGKRRSRGHGGQGFGVVLLVMGLVAVMAMGLGEGDVMRGLWWVFGAVCVVLVLLGVWWWRRMCKEVRDRRSMGMSGVDEMSGDDFEKYVGSLLVAQGWESVRVVGGSEEQSRGRGYQGDFGADVVGKRNGVLFAVQAKRYRGFVGVEAIYQVLGGRDYYHCEQTMVVTNSRFSDQAWELSRKTGTELVDRRRLQEWISEYEEVELPWWCLG